MVRFINNTLILFFLIMVTSSSNATDFRPPATPLITIDPYTSCWSFDDRLYDDWPKHWTGSEHQMCGMIRVDGVTMRFMGGEITPTRTAHQTSLNIRPTQSIYTFTCGSVDLTVTFTSPLLLSDLELLSRPASYITFTVQSNDGNKHEVDIYLDVSSQWAVTDEQQLVVWDRQSMNGLDIMRIGTEYQGILGRQGDNVRIDWGYALVAVQSSLSETVIADAEKVRSSFSLTGKIMKDDDSDMPRGVNDRMPVMASILNPGVVGTKPVERHIIVGYDDIYSIEYFYRRLAPWWRRNGDATSESMLNEAERDYKTVIQRCEQFDSLLLSEATKLGGAEYAQLCALVYRQTIAAHKLVADTDGKPLFFSKENFSNGCIGTVDVTFPSAPLFLIYNPNFVKGMLEPIFYYRESGRYQLPYAPHDVGQYPRANGQRFPMEGMPVEECGNMILLTTAITYVEEDASYAREHWEVLTEWAHYLKEKGFDPENQYCTDDFAGH
ncbi:glutaminase domain-containing protein, partial [Candidatus Latescibacterota bacterium]